MKKRRISSILLISLSVIMIVALTFFIPSEALRIYTDSFFDKKNQVPSDSYANSASSISIMASKQLTDYERIRLISGLWNSNIQQVNDVTGSEEYNIVNTAKVELNKLASAGLYPYEITDNDMYYWDAKKYKCIESNFGSLSANYWKIKLIQYDNSLSHDILITDEGIILNIEYNGIPSGEKIVSIDHAFHSLPIASGRLCSYTALEPNDYVPSYRYTPLPDKIDAIGVVTLGSYWVQTNETLNTFYENNYESFDFYTVFQSYEENESDNTCRYVFQIIPYAPDSGSINNTVNNAIKW